MNRAACEKGHEKAKDEKSRSCQLNKCSCPRSWVEKGWFCPLVWERPRDRFRVRDVAWIISGVYVTDGEEHPDGDSMNDEDMLPMVGQCYRVKQIHRNQWCTWIKVHLLGLGDKWVRVWVRWGTHPIVVAVVVRTKEDE